MLRKLFGRDNGETEFQAAKAIWETISTVVIQPFKTEADKKAYLAIQKPLIDVMRLLHKASQKNHHEATRCYAGLSAIRLVRKGELFINEKSFESWKNYWLENKKNLLGIAELLNRPQFAEDGFAQNVIFGCLFWNGDLVLSQLNKTQHIPSILFSAFAMIKAKELDYNLRNVETAFSNAKSQWPKEPDTLYLFMMQSEKMLEMLKSFTLKDAKWLLRQITTPMTPKRCDFFEIPLPSEQEIKKVIVSLLEVVQRLETLGNTRSILPVLDQLPPAKRQLEEKREEGSQNVSAVKVEPAIVERPEARNEAHVSLRMSGPR